MIPTSIDGTDITGATIDGTDVTEITVDGQTVFTAQTLPVAYTNLIAWYPFDGVEYGGSNTDDVTAIIGGSGDDTAYNLSNATGSPTHTNNGIATDINAGANSGAFDYDGSDDAHKATGLNINGLSEFTISIWIELDTILTSGGVRRWVGNSIAGFNNGTVVFRQRSGNVEMVHNVAQAFVASTTNAEMWTMTSDISGCEIYKNGSSVGTINSTLSDTSEDDLYIGGYFQGGEYTDGIIDDVRIYNKELSAAEVNQIYQNTKP